MASLMGILTTASLAVFLVCGHLLGFASPPMHTVTLGLVLLAASSLIGKMRLGRSDAMDYGQLFFVLLAWSGLWTSAPGAPRFVIAHPEAGLLACLIATGLLPMLLGREPFTMPRARLHAPPQVWDTPAFRSINRRLSWMWIGLLLACLASTLAPDMVPGLGGQLGRAMFLGALPLALLLGVGLPMDRRYPGAYLRARGLPSFDEQARAAARPSRAKTPRMLPPLFQEKENP